MRDVAALVNEGAMLGDAGRAAEALSRFEEATLLTHSDDDLYQLRLNKGLALQALFRHREAISVLRAAHEHAPTGEDHVAAEYLAMSHVELAREQEHDAGVVSELLAAAAELLPTRAELSTAAAASHHSLGVQLASSGRHEEALHKYGKSLALDPAHAPTWVNRGLSLDATTRLDEAVFATATAVELSVELAPAAASAAYLNLGLLQRKQLDELRRRHDRHGRRRPSSSAVAEEALGSFSAARRLAPSRGDGWYYAANGLISDGRSVRTCVRACVSE